MAPDEQAPTESEERYVNCSECGEEINAKDIAGRMKGRPLCADCCEISHGIAGKPRGKHPPGDLDPWGENCTRAREGD